MTSILFILYSIFSISKLFRNTNRFELIELNELFDKRSKSEAEFT